MTQKVLKPVRRHDPSYAEYYIDKKSDMQIVYEDVGNPWPLGNRTRDGMWNDEAKKRHEAKARELHGERIKARAEANKPWPADNNLTLTDWAGDRLHTMASHAGFVVSIEVDSRELCFGLSMDQTDLLITYLQAQIKRMKNNV